MPLFRDERRVRHNAVQMFDLRRRRRALSGIRSAMQGAQGAQARRAEPDGRETLVADMSVGYKLIRETSRAGSHSTSRTWKLRVEYIDGPFSRLENIWTFKEEPEGRDSRVNFFIDYEFKSRTLGMLMGSMFDAAFPQIRRRFRTARRRHLWAARCRN